jgi:hypothetical protein
MVDNDTQHPNTARLVDVTKVPASEVYARRHVEDENDWSVTKSTGHQAVEAWWNNAVDYPEEKGKQDMIRASNADQVDNNPSSKRVRRDSVEQPSKRVRLGSKSASPSATPAAQTPDNSVDGEKAVIDLTGDSDVETPAEGDGDYGNL